MNMLQTLNRWLATSLGRGVAAAIALVLAWLFPAEAPAGLLLLPFFLGEVLLDDTNTVTQKTIMPGVVDNFFRAGPVIAYLKSRFTRKWIGPQIQENYLFRSQRGGAYLKGQSFNILKRQTRTGMLFTPRYYEVNVTEFLEDSEVEQTGPNAMFNIIKTDMAEAALTMSGILEIAIFHHGQNLAGDDRSAEINGLEEALTNGTNTTWTGSTFTSYGGQLRSSVNNALNSPVGLVAASQTSTSFRVLNHSYLSACIGNEHPILGVTTNRNSGSSRRPSSRTRSSTPRSPRSRGPASSSTAPRSWRPTTARGRTGPTTPISATTTPAGKPSGG